MMTGESAVRLQKKDDLNCATWGESEVERLGWRWRNRMGSWRLQS